MNAPPHLPSASDVKKKYPHVVFYETIVSISAILPLLLAYYALLNLCFKGISFKLFIPLWTNIIFFKFYSLGFIFLYSSLITVTMAAINVHHGFKQHLTIFLTLALTMAGYNIQFLALILSTIAITVGNGLIGFLVIPEFAFGLFLIMHAYVIVSKYSWVDEHVYGFSDMKESFEFFKGMYWIASVVLTGLLAILWVTQSESVLLVVIFTSGIMVMVAVVNNLFKKLLIRALWMEDI